MSVGLLFECDDLVAKQFLAPRNQLFFKYDRAVGLVDGDKLIGAILFHGWNGSNLEVSYQGKNTLSAGIMRYMAKYVIKEFDLARLTVVTSKRNRHFIKSLQKFGFRLEGTQRCYYGKRDCTRNTGVRFVAFRDRIEEVANFNVPNEGAKQCS